MAITPVHLDLKRGEALTVRWSDGRVSVYPVAYLRRMSPSADAIEMRDALANNPLAVLPDSGDVGALRAERIEPVGRYAVRLVFSDGHHTGLYSWTYLREIDPGCEGGDSAAGEG